MNVKDFVEMMEKTNEHETYCVEHSEIKKLLAIIKIQTEALEQIDTDECCGDWCSARKSEIATSALTKANEVAGI